MLSLCPNHNHKSTNYSLQNQEKQQEGKEEVCSLKGLFNVPRRIIIIYLSWSHVHRSAAFFSKFLDSTGRVSRPNRRQILYVCAMFGKSHVIFILFVLGGAGLLSSTGGRSGHLRLLRRLLHLKPLLLSQLCLLLSGFSKKLLLLSE